jgi:hypothetical protein
VGENWANNEQVKNGYAEMGEAIFIIRAFWTSWAVCWTILTESSRHIHQKVTRRIHLESPQN